MLEEALLVSLDSGHIVVLKIHASSQSSFRYSSARGQPAVDSYDQVIEESERKIQAKNVSLLELRGGSNRSTQAFATFRPECFYPLFRSDTDDLSFR